MRAVRKDRLSGARARRRIGAVIRADSATDQEMTMPARPIVSRFARAAVAGALALPFAGLAQERTSGATLIVTVFADRYVAANVSFPSLDALTALVQPMNPSLVRLEACGPASATALLAAAERLRDSRLELSVLAESAPACAAVPLRAVQVSQVAGTVPVGAASVPTERYWRSVMP
jgi:hypothetical protein